MGYGLAGLAIAPNGIAILLDNLGRTQGEAYVKFAEPQLVEKALAKHKEKIRHRWAVVKLDTGRKLTISLTYNLVPMEGNVVS